MPITQILQTMKSPYLNQLKTLVEMSDELIQSHPHIDFDLVLRYKHQLKQQARDFTVKMSQVLQESFLETPRATSMTRMQSVADVHAVTNQSHSSPTLFMEMEFDSENKLAERPRTEIIVTGDEDDEVQPLRQTSPSPSSRSKFSSFCTELFANDYLL